jgi:SAM-dependent methyltransferase
VKEPLLDWLVCPTCRGPLTLVAATGRGEDIVDGRLVCHACDARYPIVRGIPRLVPGDLPADAASTAERFGYEWTHFDEIRPEYDAQFRGWIAPVDPGAFRGRRVLDAGCGKGRHLVLASRYGASDVVGIELGPAIEAAASNTARVANVHLVQGDITRPPFRPRTFDLIYSIGVLHHLREPQAGFLALAPLLTADGILAAWVYAREGNRWVVALVDPVRRRTSRLPLGLVSVLAWTLTVPLWASLRLVYGPARRWPWLLPLLPYASYLVDLTPFPFRELHSIAFDHLLAPVAHYMGRPEVERCIADAGLRLRSLRWHHRNSWAACSVRR